MRFMNGENRNLLSGWKYRDLRKRKKNSGGAGKIRYRNRLFTATTAGPEICSGPFRHLDSLCCFYLPSDYPALTQ